MENIISHLRMQDQIDPLELASMVRERNRDIRDVGDHVSKKKALGFYLSEKERRTDLWESWGVSSDLDARIVRTLQMKPRRTASGVATITVVAKPMGCQNSCVYCPNDVRMPKSYLSDEPACQRAERNFFDPYLQVASRLKALREMGHPTDKIELIVLGGTWDDYPRPYQIWFIKELFRALNEPMHHTAEISAKRHLYERAGLSSDSDAIRSVTAPLQELVDAGKMTYNDAVKRIYGPGSAWERVSQNQTAAMQDLKTQHKVNESAHHRVVGLVVETRPNAISAESLIFLRQLGCTKVQIGIQSLDSTILAKNERETQCADVPNALSMLRLFGFKTHIHYMLNLYSSSPDDDLAGYKKLVEDPRYRPDEVKLYPCVLVAGTKLCSLHEKGAWQPYCDEELVRLLADIVVATPSYTRISRMIRDISAHDIIAGSKKTNLRQTVERLVRETGANINEIRLREISTETVSIDSLMLDETSYDTSTTKEFFLQWVTPDMRIAGFLRLSLPKSDSHPPAIALTPLKTNRAMIREVHVYGRAARLHSTGAGTQHLGLGRRLVKRACEIAREHGFAEISVISAIGTKEYYRSLGFTDEELYQVKDIKMDDL